MPLAGGAVPTIAFPQTWSLASLGSFARRKAARSDTVCVQGCRPAPPAGTPLRGQTP